MTVCIFCDGSGFSLNNGWCPECNGTGKDNFNYDVIICDDDPEDIRSAESLDIKLGCTIQ